MDPAEPRNGDFIAYLDRLQRESAARVLVDPHRADGARTTKRFQIPPVAVAGLAAFQVFIGVILALYWRVATADIVSPVIALALIIWNVRVLRRALRRTPPRQRKQISKFFQT